MSSQHHNNYSPYYNAAADKENSSYVASASTSVPIGIPFNNIQQQQYIVPQHLNSSSSHHHHTASTASAASLDADTVAYATAAAAAAYHDAIAARTGNRIAAVSAAATSDTPPRIRNFANVPPTPTSPTRSSLMPSYGSDTSSPMSAPLFNGNIMDHASGFPLVGSPTSGRKMHMQQQQQRTPQRHLDTPPTSGGAAGSRHRALSNDLQVPNNGSEDSIGSVSPVDVAANTIHTSDSQETLNSTNGQNNSPNSTASSNENNASSNGKKVERADSKKLNLYKTELCRSWEETGTCRYGNKCQFAHSVREVRNIDRHPKYKTEMCKTFWDKGTCPYGKRCCFIHTERQKSSSGSSKQSPSPQSATEERAPPPMSPMQQVTPPRARANSSATHLTLDDSTDSLSGGGNGSSARRSGKQSLGIFTDRSILGAAAGAATAPAMVNNGNGKSLFDAISSHDFALWSPSLASPERANGNGSAFSFDQRTINESYMRQHYGPPSATVTAPTPSSTRGHLDDNISQVEQALQSFQINSPLDVTSAPSNPLALLSPITTRFNNDFRSDIMHNNFSRSAMSAGIPTTSQAFFGGAILPECSYGDDLSIDRFRRSRAPTGASLSSVPILATPPRGINSSSASNSASNSIIINSGSSVTSSNSGGPQSAYAKTRSDSFGSNFRPLSGDHFGTSLLDNDQQQQPITNPHRILSNNTVSPATFAQVVYPAKHQTSNASATTTTSSNNNNNNIITATSKMVDDISSSEHTISAHGPVGRHGSLRKFDSGVSFYAEGVPGSPRPLQK